MSYLLSRGIFYRKSEEPTTMRYTLAGDGKGIIKIMRPVPPETRPVWEYVGEKKMTELERWIRELLTKGTR